MTNTTYRDIEITPLEDGYTMKVGAFEYWPDDVSGAKVIIDEVLSETYQHRAIGVTSAFGGEAEFTINGERYSVNARTAPLRRAAAIALLDAMLVN